MKKGDKPGKVRVGLVQMSCSDNPDENMKKALALTEDAVRQGAQVICLPELFRSRYFCQSEDATWFALAEAIPGPSTEAFSKIAARHDVAIIISLFEKRAPGLYHNTTAVVDGNSAWGQVTAARAISLAIAKAKAHGTAAICVRNCYHVGRVGVYPLRAAKEGLICLVFANGHGVARVAPMNRSAFARTDFSSRRSTTRSSMPFSSRNSLRWKPSGSV
mgnify:CR=1 FL=1